MASSTPATALAPRAAAADATARYLEARQTLPTVSVPDPSALTEEERRALRGMVMYDRVEPPTAEELASAAFVSEDPVKVSASSAGAKPTTTWEELAKRRGGAGGAKRR